MLVKIFDLTAIAKKFAGSHVVEERYTTRDINALLVGEKQFILTEYDSVHSIHDRGLEMYSEFITLKAGKRSPETLVNGAIINAEVPVSIPVELFLKEMPVREEEFSTFINARGSRKESNYAQLLESILKIGLDPKDFPDAR